MTFWKKLPLATQYLLMLLLIVGLMVTLSLTLARDINVSAKLNEARTVTDMVENIGTWSAQYKGVWVRKESTDSKLNVGDFLNQEYATAASSPSQAASVVPPLSENPTDTVAAVAPDIVISSTTFHQKNPALIQREMSQITEKSSAKAKFRMTSDKFMNPDNAPNLFEMTALEAIRAKKDSNEFFQASDSELNYARGITAKASCMKCHDTPEKAPKAVREKYPSLRGYGYKEGEVIGVISVKVPLDNAGKTLIDNLSRNAWIIVIAFISALMLMFYVIRSMIIAPLRRLKKFADDVRDAEPGISVKAPAFVKDEYSSKNEIHQLSQALKALQGAIKIFNS